MTKLKSIQLNLKKLSSLFWILGFLICSITAHANPTIPQSIKISGTVVDAEDNMPIPGVNVVVKGTSTGTVTDFDGNYTIDVPASTSVLVFSSIGYAKKKYQLSLVL
ncbi:carboxypeptidase-like regulatory domain-containing protein [Cellulophaga baltica 4]|nr:carboxypeptidase-like regulatory domain-containing protein [Cellulophaga baltica 4]